jgi:hypothetical protein
MLMTDIGLRFTLPHPVQGKVVGDISYSAWQIKKMPEAVKTLKARMGPLWNAKYRPNEPATMGLLDDFYIVAARELQRMKHPPGEPLPSDIRTEKDVASFVENGITSEDFKTMAESKKKVRMLMKELT